MTTWAASSWDGRARGPLRAGLAVVAGSNLLGAAWEVWQDCAGPWSHPQAPPALLALAGSVWVWPLALLGLAALLAFARAPVNWRAGALALAATALLVEADGAINEGPKRHFFAPGLVLLGWLAGLGFARLLLWRARLRLTDFPAWQEALAEVGAVAALAANYVDAALSKLRHVGPEWANDTTLRSIVLSHHVLGDTSWQGRYAHAVASHAAVSQALSYATLAVQLGAVLMLLGPRWRLIAGLAVVSFHLQVQWLADIGYGPARSMLLLLCLPWPWWVDLLLRRWPALPGAARLHRWFAPVRDAAPALPHTVLRDATLVACLALAACAALANALSISDYAAQHHSYGGERAGPRPPPPRNP